MANTNTVIIITKARPLQEETYFGVASNKKKAEEKIRKAYPHMRKIEDSFGTSYSSGKDNEFLFFLKEETVD